MSEAKWQYCTLTLDNVIYSNQKEWKAFEWLAVDTVTLHFSCVEGEEKE